MEKVIILLHRADDRDADNFRDALLATAPELAQAGAKHLRICAADTAVSAADAFRIAGADVYDAFVSFWLDSARQVTPILAMLAQQDANCCAYLVTESEPITKEISLGQRTAGMNQIVTLKVPERLSYDEWLEIWLQKHTQLAIDIQATFGYRQNVVVRHLKDNQPDFAAIVEENFPEAAMSSRQAFYDCVDNEELYQQREQQMMESTMRFIDFEEINCVAMSEYNF